MATATRSPLTEQAEKLAGFARELTEGRLLQNLLRLAQSGDVWSGPIHDAFLAWLQQGLDFWVRNQLGEGVRLVAKFLADRAAAIEQAQQAMAAGQIGVVGPAAPTPLNYVPGAPPPYGQIGGGPNNQFKTEGMQKLTQLLGQTADTSLDFARRLRDALVPPPLPPPAPGAPPPISPLPPDAESAAGSPSASTGNAYLAIANELRNAAADIAKRADALRLLEEPLPTTTIDMSGVNAAAGAAGAAVGSSTEALTGAQAPGGETAAPRSPEDIEKSRQGGKEAAAEVAKVVSDKNFDQKDHEKLFKALTQAERSADDPEFAAAFVDSFVPDGLRSWCKLMNASVINLQVEMDILRPMSRLIGTASQAGDQFPPETRQALMDSQCLDTIVQHGKYDSEFALAAARRILEDPDRYQRVDGSDRVYSQVDSEGHYEKGDARVGALRLLVNNPDAAQEILETHGPHGRRLILDALEDDGIAGREAAAALQAGLTDLNRPASEDTLELVIREVAHGGIALAGPGKEALSRILSSEQVFERLREIAIADLSEEKVKWLTGDQGFRVPFDTFQKCIGKVLDDKGAHAAFLNGMAMRTADELRRNTEALGKTQLVEPENLSVLKTSIEDMGRLFQGVAKGVEDASGTKEKNAFLAAGLGLAVSEAVKLVPGGFAGKFVVDKALETTGSESLDHVLEASEKQRIKNLDKDGLTKELNHNARTLALVSLLRDRSVTDQLVPLDSPLRKNWDKDGDGQIEMPDPNASEWQDFTRDLKFERARGSPIGRAVLEISNWTESFKV